MNVVPLLFWVALVIPGYALLCRFERDELKSGLLGVLGLSYLATFTLVMPVAIAGYWLRLPLVVLSAWCVLLVLAGVVEIIRGGHWRLFGQLLLGAVGLELLLLLVDLVCSVRVGSMLSGDAVLHLGRIRFLVDHGLSNIDPMIAGEYFYPIYHTNLLHALCAAGTQLTGGDHLSVWRMALPLAKLLIIAGGFYLTWVVFERQWPAWAVAVFLLVAQGPVSFLVYPNKLAPLCVLPFMIAFAIQLWRQPGWWPVIKLAAGVLLLGQLHALYAGFALVLLGPVLAVLAVWHLMRRRPGALPLGAGVAALLLCIPLVLPARGNRVKGSPTAVARAARESAVEQQASGARGGTPVVDWSHFIPVGDASLIRDPRRGFGGGYGFRVLWLAGGVAGAWLVGRRREALLLLSVMGIVAAIFFIPPLCTAAIDVLGKGWILRRLEIVWLILLPVFVPGALVALVEQRLIKLRPVQSVLSLLAIPLALYVNAREAPHDWPTYRKAVVSSAAERTLELRRLRELRELLAAHVPPGATVLARPGWGIRLVQVYDCHLIAPLRGSVGVPGLHRTRAEVQRVMRGEVTPTQLDEFLAEHDVEYLFAGQQPDWVAARGMLLGGTAIGELWRILQKGEAQDVMGRLEAYVEANPEDAEAHLHLARSLMAQQRWVEAGQVFERLRDLHPGDAIGHYEHGNLLVRQRRWEEALEAYSAALEVQSAFPDAYCNRGYVLLELKRVDEALRDLDAALALEGRHVLAHYHRARALLRQGDRAGALVAVERALELAPTYAPARQLRQRIESER